MGRYSRLHPVHTTKHVVDKQGAIPIDTSVNETLVASKDAPVRANVTEVETGSHVNAIFLNVQVAPTTSAALCNVYMYVIKSPGNNLSLVDGNKVGASDIKKFVLHQEMLMVERESGGAVPRTLFKGVIKIPGSYKRFGADDVLKLNLYAPGCIFDFCYQTIYKEIR